MSNKYVVKLQEGGQLGNEQEQFTLFLIDTLEPESPEHFDEIISNLSENDLKELYKEFKNKTISFAKEGAKLNRSGKVQVDNSVGRDIFNTYVDHIKKLN